MCSVVGGTFRPAVTPLGGVTAAGVRPMPLGVVGLVVATHRGVVAVAVEAGGDEFLPSQVLRTWEVKPGSERETMWLLVTTSLSYLSESKG